MDPCLSLYRKKTPTESYPGGSGTEMYRKEKTMEKRPSPFSVIANSTMNKAYTPIQSTRPLRPWRCHQRALLEMSTKRVVEIRKSNKEHQICRCMGCVGRLPFLLFTNTPMPVIVYIYVKTMNLFTRDNEPFCLHFISLIAVSSSFVLKNSNRSFSPLL